MSDSRITARYADRSPVVRLDLDLDGLRFLCDALPYWDEFTKGLQKLLYEVETGLEDERRHTEEREAALAPIWHSFMWGALGVGVPAPTGPQEESR